ncbi:MAG TPA: UDP-glucose/GDP-mannose dehydrogenase family protein [Ktedonobacterales bacterium]|jgi:UDPglucose 6-dehydrogenase|nr:UDP-glucose/GDP-mannose dehydrogenase family protein [Ktedonobacterales bacterium]
MRKICVVGTGYVGLVTGTCLADLGNDVTCLDVVPEKIARLRAGELPIYEPGLEPMVKRNADAGRLHFTTNYAEAVARAEFIFIAVNTPTIQGGAGADMSYVESAARSIAEHLSGDAIIVNKSTMPVGSGDLVSAIVHEHLSDSSLHVAVVSNPEFLREGSAVQDFSMPDRVVLGSTDRDAASKVAQLYLPLRAAIVITDLYTAEMIKYASNAFLATKISFINEIARICDRLGADVKEVAAGMGYDKRIGRSFLDAGLGYGGSCFPKDVKALAHMAGEAGLHPQLLDAVMKINEDQRHVAIQKLEEELGGEGSLNGKTIAVLGLAFKDNTDDMREAASIDIVHWLVNAGATVRAFDPVAVETAQKVMPREGIAYCADEYDAAKGADSVIVVTEWKRFREIDFERLYDELNPDERGPVLVDGRNLYDPAEMRRLGFRYHGIGRGSERRNGNGNGHHAAAAAQQIAPVGQQ